MKRSKKLSPFLGLLIILSLVISSCSTSLPLNTPIVRAPSSDGIFLSEINSEEENLKILMAIHKEIPELFSEAALFDIDLMKIIEDQRELQKLLKRYPEFVKKWNARQLLEIDMVVEDKNAPVIQTKQISLKSFSDWQTNLKKAAEDIFKSKKDLDAVVRETNELLSKRTSGGFLNGLILNLPAASQVEARKLQKSMDAVVLEMFLSAHLPDTLTNFKSNPPEKSLSKIDLISKWKVILNEERQIGFLTDLSLMIHNRKIDLRELYSLIGKLERQDMRVLTDPDYQANGFSKIFNQETPKTPKYYQKYLESQQDDMEVVSSRVENKYSLKMREQNPNVAALRGIVGKNCASQKSCPYSNDPNERVFFIYDKNDHLKGYLEATMVKDSKGKNSLYVITVAGNRVNATDMELMFQTLYQEKAALGVESIIGLSLENLKSLIDFAPIAEFYSDVLKQKSDTKIIYNDKELRTQIQEFRSVYNAGQYDHMTRNTNGPLYVPNPEKKIDFKATISKRPIEAKNIQIKDKVEIESFLEFYLALKKSNRADIASQALDLLESSNDKEEFNKMVDTILTKERISTSEVEERLADFVKYFNISSTANQKIHDVYLTHALMQATDAHNEPYKKENIKKLLSDFKFSKYDTVLGRSSKIYKEWTPELIAQESYEKLRIPYLTLLKDESADIIALSGDIRFSLAVAKAVPEEYLPTGGRLIFLMKTTPGLLSKNLISKLIEEAYVKKDVASLRLYIQYIFSSPHTEDWSDLVSRMMAISKDLGKKEINLALIEYAFNRPHAVKWSPLLDQMIKTKDPEILKAVIYYVLAQPHATAYTNQIKEVIKIAVSAPEFNGLMNELGNHVLTKAGKNNWKDIVIEFLRAAKKINYIEGILSVVHPILGSPEAREWRDVIEEVIQTAKELKSKAIFQQLANSLFSNAEAGKMQDLILDVIKWAAENQDGKTLEKLETNLRFRNTPEWANIKKVLEGRSFSSSTDYTKLLDRLNALPGAKKADIITPATNCKTAIKAFL